MKPFILFLPRWYPNKYHPFHGIFVKRHAEAVSSFARIVVLFVSAEETVTKGLYESEHLQQGAVTEVHYYFRKNFTGIRFLDKLIKLLLYFYCSWKGYQSIRQQYGDPQLLHAHVMTRTVLFALILNYFLKKEFVYTEHWGGYHPEDGNYTGYFKKALTRWCISKAKVIMPVTQNLANVMQFHDIKGTYRIVPNVVDTTLFRPSSTAQTNEPKVVVHISNFDPKAKNVEGILEVARKVTQHRNDFVLHIIGYGPNEQELKQQAESLGVLDKTVYFLGPKSGEELVQHIQKSDFLFMFSHYENQPCVIMEAMACGKPILATTVGGISEMVDASIGLLSRPKNVEEMSALFERMLDTASQYDASLIHNTAEQKYSYTVVGKMIADVYASVLGIKELRS